MAAMMGCIARATSNSGIASQRLLPLRSVFFPALKSSIRAMASRIMAVATVRGCRCWSVR